MPIAQRYLARKQLYLDCGPRVCQFPATGRTQTGGGVSSIIQQTRESAGVPKLFAQPICQLRDAPLMPLSFCLQHSELGLIGGLLLSMFLLHSLELRVIGGLLLSMLLLHSLELRVIGGLLLSMFLLHSLDLGLIGGLLLSMFLLQCRNYLLGPVIFAINSRYISDPFIKGSFHFLGCGRRRLGRLRSLYHFG